MKKLGRLLLWDILLLHRQQLILVSLVVTAIYIGIFFLLKGLGNIETLLTILVFTDPVVTAMMFAAVIVLFEKDQQTLSAIKVSPLPPSAFIASKALSLSLLATLCGWLMAVVSYEFGFNHRLFLTGVFATSLAFSLGGLWLGMISSSFNNFLANSIGLMIFLGVPFISMFGYESWWLYLFPSMATLLLIEGSITGLAAVEIVYAVLYLLVQCGLVYRLALKTFVNKL